MHPQSHSTPSHDHTPRARHHSPWRSHVRTHRRNIARARAQLGFDDSLEVEDDETFSSKTEEEPEEKSEEQEVEEKEDEEQTEEEEKVEMSEETTVVAEGTDGSPQDHSCGEEEEVQQIENQLSSLELEPTSPNSTDPELPTPTPPPDAQPDVEPNSTSPSSVASTSRPSLDSSSSESGSSIRRSPSNVAEEPVKPQIFSPFPCIKTPRRSAAARNLGLYGPTARTPNVHFPQMSRSMNRIGSTTKRR